MNPGGPLLLCVGASARAAAMSIARSDCRPLAADLFADADLAAQCPCLRLNRLEDLESMPTEFELLCRRAAGWFYCGGIENHPQLIQRLSDRIELLGNAPTVVHAVRDPYRLADCLRPCASSGDDVMRRIKSVAVMAVPTRFAVGPGNHDWLLKPTRSAGGTHIRRLNEIEMAEGVSRGPGANYYLQQFIEGTSYGGLFVADGKSADFIGVTRQLIGKTWGNRQPFGYAGSIGPLPLHGDCVDIWRCLGGLLANHFQLKGIFGVDAVWDGKSLWPVEINPRYTASVELHERATGWKAIAAHLSGCGRGDLLPGQAAAPSPSAFSAGAPKADQPMHGKLIVYAQCDVRWAPRPTEYGIRHDEKLAPPFADIPAQGELIEAGRPILTAFASGATAAVVARRLREAAQRVRERVCRHGDRRA